MSNFQKLKIPFITVTNNPNYDNIKQITTFYSVELIKIVIGDTQIQTTEQLVNNLENIVRDLRDNQGITKFLLDLSSNIIVSWALGDTLIYNNGYYCDKKERFEDCKFFCSDNSLSYNNSPFELLLIVRNLYRFADVTSGQSTADIVNTYNNILYPNGIPDIQYVIYQLGDNASESSLTQIQNVGNILNIPTILIPFQVIIDPNPINQQIFGGLCVSINNSFDTLNEYVNDLNNTNKNVLINFIINGFYNNSLTNTILNYPILINSIHIPTTMFEIFINISNIPTQNARNRFIGSNYNYSQINNILLPISAQQIPPLPITQYSNNLDTRIIWNPILDRLGFLPPYGGSGSSIINIEIIAYIFNENNNSLRTFCGIQDNRFRFDQLTQRSRISALLVYYTVLANTFTIVESRLTINEDNVPSVL